MSENTARATEGIAILRHALAEQAVTPAEAERRVDADLATYIERAGSR